MRNLISILFRRQTKYPASRWLLLFFLTLGLSTGWKCAQASTPQTAPSQVQNMLSQIDAAASKGDVKGVMQFYSSNFTHGDGLSRQTMEKALTAFWNRYPNLRYNTQLQSWKAEGNNIVVETVTNITAPPNNKNNLALNATIRSRQRVAGTQIVRQEIISERTQISSGSKPPQIEVRLPEQVKVGQQYSFDAIVQEPLGEDYLLGTALEEPVQPDKFLRPTPVNLELLSSGGLFKVGRAPNNPGSQWVSAVIMRGEGMTMITQRIQVVRK
ncbi:MAG: nuclear transport factor 2 family protein [Scytonematopsis contorta HA4267-MV1]|jgi:hypothetical protein|nr:nuclear transport factor 2 family protein [Scytonematopsis contorta HA4267-MV1]